MQKTTAFAIIACIVLLSGCVSTVPQSKYDSLAQECGKQKAEAASALDDMTAKAGSFKVAAADCASSRQASEKVISDQASQINAMKADSAALSSARQKTALISSYRKAQAYFNDSYGPGSVPTTPKLKVLEAQIISLNDQTLYGAWQDFSKCSYLIDCQNAKARFSSIINSTIVTLTYQAADIVAKSG